MDLRSNEIVPSLGHDWVNIVNIRLRLSLIYLICRKTQPWPIYFFQCSKTCSSTLERAVAIAIGLLHFGLTDTVSVQTTQNLQYPQSRAYRECPDGYPIKGCTEINLLPLIGWEYFFTVPVSFILAVPMCKYLGKHSCMSYSYPLAILNRTWSLPWWNDWQVASLENEYSRWRHREEQHIRN